jgi:hypothetical protein
MSRAFADFIKENHDGLVKLAAIYGGVKGGKLGSRLGPKGALGGALIGAGAAAAGTDALLDEAEASFRRTPQTDARIAALQTALNELTNRASKLKPIEFGGFGPQLREIAASAKGGFSGAAIGQRFGIGDSAVLNKLGIIADGKGKLPAKIGDEVSKALENLFRLK